MSKYLQFDIESAELIKENEDSEFVTASIDAFSSGITRNDTICDSEELKISAPTIYEKPILFTIDKNFQDFFTHVEPEKSLIAGFVIPGSATFKIDSDRTTLNVKAKIWSNYATRFLDVFKEDRTNRKKVSVEVKLLDFEKLQDGLLHMKRWIFSGICVLGDLVTEASIGANLVLNFAEENEKIRKAYQKEFSSKYSDLDLLIPESIKANIEKGLSLYKSKGKGTNSVVLALAHYLQKNTHADPNRIKNMAKMLNNYAKKDLSDENSNDYISYLALGGQDGHKWACELASAIEKIDNQKLSYFEDDPNKKEVVSMTEEEKMAEEERVKKEEEEKKFAEEEAKKKTEEEEAKKREEEESKKENMSNNPNLDVAAALAFLKSETESNQDMVDENQAAMFAEMEKGEMCNHAVVAKGVFALYQKMCGKVAEMKEMCNRMSVEKEETDKKFAEKEEMCNKMSAENEELKKFKADIEKERFTFAVESVLKEVEKILPKEEYDKVKEDAANYNLENITTWANTTRAMAFTFSGGKEHKEDDTVKIGLVWGNEKPSKKSLWD